MAAAMWAAEQMITQQNQQILDSARDLPSPMDMILFGNSFGRESLLLSLDIAPQANATPEQQCTRCPCHERDLVEREVGRLLTTVLGSRHVREPSEFLRHIRRRILELV